MKYLGLAGSLLLIGRRAAKQCLGTHSDWYLLLFVLLIFPNMLASSFPLFTFTFSLVVLVLSANLFPSELGSRMSEFAFISRNSFSVAMVLKFICLYLFLISVSALILLSVLPVNRGMRLIVNTLLPVMEFHDAIEPALLPKIWVQSLVPFLFIQSLMFMLSCYLKSAVRTMFVGMLFAFFSPSIPAIINPFFLAAPARDMLLPPNWLGMFIANRLTLFILSLVFCLAAMVKLSRFESFIE